MRTSTTIQSKVLLKAQAIKVLFLDVDGVMTDGGLYFSEQGETLKRFNTLDGHGLKLLQSAGIIPAIISGRDAKALRIRLETLGITQARFGVENKVKAAEELMHTMQVSWKEVASMGDDWPDIALMKRSAFSCAPPNAHIEVKTHADYVTVACGGEGAVRELCDLILIANGSYDLYLKEASE
jgi:3-deoxy-D-manno-octulosonate 8-phosphate phosphatase (KDO 8-P phosphatase)